MIQIRTASANLSAGGGYNPNCSAALRNKVFLPSTLLKVNFQRFENKNPSAYGTGIVFDVGHTGFEPVTSTLSR